MGRQVVKKEEKHHVLFDWIEQSFLTAAFGIRKKQFLGEVALVQK